MTSLSNNRPGRSLIASGFVGGQLGYHLRVAHVRSLALFTKNVGDPALTPLAMGTLSLIDEHPGINQRDLAGILSTDPSTMVRLIDQLEKRGWVVRETAPYDRRHTVPRATEEGRAALARIQPLMHESECELAGDLSAEERATLVRLLKRLRVTASAETLNDAENLV